MTAGSERELGAGLGRGLASRLSVVNWERRGGDARPVSVSPEPHVAELSLGLSVQPTGLPQRVILASRGAVEPKP